MVMGLIPVSVFSCLLYLVMVVSLWTRGDLMIWLRSLFAWILLSAALWFIALQLFVMQIICPYCMVVHGLGVSIGLVVLLTRPREKKKGFGLFGDFVAGRSAGCSFSADTALRPRSRNAPLRSFLGRAVTATVR